MAKAELKFPDEFAVRLSKLGSKTDEITEDVLKAGAKVVLRQVKYNLAFVIGNGTKIESRSTGELYNSLGISPAKIDDKGNFNVKIGFYEPRSDGKVNAKIANIIEFGKTGQPARPFLARAKRQSKKLCEAAMIKIFEEEVKKL